MIAANYIGNIEKGADLLKLARAERKMLRSELANKLWQLRAKMRRRGAALSAAMLTKSLLAIEEKHQDIVIEAHAECLQVALEVAREVIASEIESNPKSLQARVQRKLSDLVSARPLTIRVAPSQSRHLETFGYSVAEDPALDPSAIIIETTAGEVKMDCFKHLENISRELRSKLALNLAGA